MPVLPALLQPLRRKLPLLITVLLCLVVGVFSALAHRILRRAFESAAEQHLAGASLEIRSMIAAGLGGATSSLGALAADPRIGLVITQPGDATQSHALDALAGHAGTSRPDAVETIWSADCRLVLAVHASPLDSAAATCPAPVEIAAHRKEQAWARPFARVGDDIKMAVVAPIRRGADTLGYMVLTTGLGSNSSVAPLEALVGPRSRIFLGNAEGTRLWTDMVKPVPATHVPDRPGTLRFSLSDGPQMGIATAVPGSPFLLWIEQPLGPAIAPEVLIMRQLLLMALGCVIIGAFGAWLVSRHVTTPIAELADAADDLARGQYERRVTSIRRDEIGLLVSAFNHMGSQVEGARRQLVAQTAELEQHYREAQDLTQELELSNQELLETTDEAHQARNRSRAATALLDEVLDRAPVGIAIVDRDLRFVRVNRALAEMHRTPVEDHLGRRPAEVRAALKNAEERFRRVLETGESIVGVRISVALLDGENSHFLSNYFPVRGPDGEITGAALITADTTSHHELEAQLLQAQKMEAVGRLAGGIAHDFNNLLTVITSYSMMALDELGPEQKLREDVAEILAAAERAAGLTRQLLTFSRKQVLQPVVLNLNDVATEMERMLRRVIGEDVTLVLDLAPDIGVIDADRGQLEQVLMNLAINARDAMPDGGRLVIQTSSECEPGGLMNADGVLCTDCVTLSVTDTGTGMSDETRAHLFEPFFTTKPVGRGTGLGLATVYGIVRQFGGSIRVRSALGAGSAFHICLPCVARDRRTTPAGGSAASSDAGGAESILLVEDDAALRQLAVRVLLRAGYSVIAAPSAEVAIELWESSSRPLDLLLTDVVMPNMNGRALAEHLMTRLPDLRVLYISGYTDDDVMRRGVRTLETAFLQKPFTPAQLTAAVRRALADE
jgi:PAS domain S-box-containing protein